MHVASTTTMQGRSPPSCRRHPLYLAWVSPRYRGPVVVRVDDVFLGSGDGVEVGVDGRRTPPATSSSEMADDVDDDDDDNNDSGTRGVASAASS